MSKTRTVIVLVFLCAAVVFAKSQSPKTTQASANGAPSTQPSEQPIPVAIAELLSEYQDNEVRADSRYKGKLVAVGGTVREVRKDIGDRVYVLIGDGHNHDLIEVPQVQAFVAAGQETKAASLSKGDPVAVRGRVDGLSMNVIINDCALFVRSNDDAGAR